MVQFVMLTFFEHRGKRRRAFKIWPRSTDQHRERGLDSFPALAETPATGFSQFNSKEENMADPRSEAAIEKLRTEIDSLDDEILELMRRRFNLSRRITTDQHRFGMKVEVFSPAREEQTLDRLKKLNDESDCPMRACHLGNIWKAIFSCTRVGW